MAAPNIKLLGATYSSVAGVTLPTSTNGTATFPWVEGSETKTVNGTYDVTNLAEVVVNVSGGGGGLVYETGTYTPASDVAAATISFSNAHSEPPFFVLMADVTNSSQTTNNSEMAWFYSSHYRAFGRQLDVGGSTSTYARKQGNYKGTSTSINATGSNETSNTTTSVSSTEFKATNGASYYWRSGRTYKWIAVWKPTT